ncbi:hypothetical protein CsSME_00050235 [Camellia sinensis var. sinensis]
MAKLELDFLLLVVLVLISFHYKPLMADSIAGTSFIKSSCRATSYPALCVHSLSSYATKIQQSDKQLAQAALAVSLARARSTSVFVSKMTKVSGMKPRERQAVKDCVENMGDTVDQLGKSIQELGRVSRRAKKSHDFMWHMSNVQTWVSAALTDESTCVDGFGEHAMDGDVKGAIKSRVVSVSKVTSNALALVNRFAARHRAATATTSVP